MVIAVNLPVQNGAAVQGRSSGTAVQALLVSHGFMYGDDDGVLPRARMTWASRRHPECFDSAWGRAAAPRSFWAIALACQRGPAPAKRVQVGARMIG